MIKSIKTPLVLLTLIHCSSALSYSIGDSYEYNITSEKKSLDEVSAYETMLPNTSWNFISNQEKELLISYLEDPSSYQTAKSNAQYHIDMAQSDTDFNSLNPHEKVSLVDHSIYALYFISRAKLLGNIDQSLSLAETSITNQLAIWFPKHAEIDTSEGRKSHKDFFIAFNYKENYRYKADTALTLDVLGAPDNITSNLYLAAVNQWIAGESEFDDPTTLYSFLKSSFFAKRTTEMAVTHQNNWEKDQENQKLYRLAPAVGGFSVPTRRWIAKFHGDKQAVAALDREVAKWFAMYPQFYLFPASIFAFNEPENFERGLQFFKDGQTACFENNNIFCEDHPRATYNIISFATLGFDYMMKAGDFDSAMNYLTYKYVPFFNYDKWTMGHDMWAHREDNAERVRDLYANDAKQDDPLNGFLNKHKWGPESSTCQMCHQAQGVEWSDSDKEIIKSLPHDQLYVTAWPDYQVEWYGELQAQLTDCSEYPKWSDLKNFTSGEKVVYSNNLYQANWWTNAKPALKPKKWDEWNIIGRCK